jgi:hypothetical protein
VTRLTTPRLTLRPIDSEPDERRAETKTDGRSEYGSTFTLAAAPRASLSLAALSDRAAREPGQVGIGALGVARLVYGFRLGVAAGADHILPGPYGGPDTAWNTGVVAGIGAPFDVTRFGLFVEAGYQERFDSGQGRKKSYRDYGYLRGSLVMRLSSTSNSTSRVWAGLSPMVISDDEAYVFLGLDVGGAWDPS